MIHGIDVHTHFVPSQFPDAIGKRLALPWPSMAHDGCGHAQVMIQGKNYRTVPSTCWDGSERVKEMDEMRIGLQVVSPMPELLSYWLPAEDAAVLLRHINEEIGQLCAAHPERFLGLGAVPLQDVDLAIRELEQLMRMPQMRGVEVATHVNGTAIGHPRFEPFFAAAENLGISIFVHALRATGTERLIGPPGLEQVLAFPGENALGIASFITGGVLERHPHLRLGFSHGGGGFAIVLPRLEHAWNVVPAIRELIPQAPSHYARRLYYDSLVYSPLALNSVIQTFGIDQIMIGSDYPFAIMDRDPHGAIDALGFNADAQAKLRAGNARRFLNWTEP